MADRPRPLMTMEGLKADLMTAYREKGCFEYRGWTIAFGGIRQPFNMFFEFGVWYATPNSHRDYEFLYATTSGCAGIVARPDEVFDWYPKEGYGTLLGQSTHQREKAIHAAGLLLLSYIDEVEKRPDTRG